MVEVIWDDNANKKRIAFLSYGIKEFGLQTALKMNERIEDYVESLANNPKMGIVEPLLVHRKRKYRSLVVHKLIKLIYYINESPYRIHIADFWDTRREPSRLARLFKGKNNK